MEPHNSGKRGHPIAGERREPLPWRYPKPADEDPDAPSRVRAILESPSYRQAHGDADFLNRYETRGVRLQIDYAKAEYLLQHYGVNGTIVVFGGTRIREAHSAQKAVNALRSAVGADPDADGRQRLGVAERLLEKSSYYDVARELGRLVGNSGGGADDCNVVIATGGGPGVMEAANRGAHDVGAKSVGLNITLPHEQYPNPYITPDLCFQFHYFAIRKLHFLLRAKALVAFPGGFGTLDELYETLTLIQTRTIQPVPVVLVGEAFWKHLLNVDFLADEGLIAPEDRELFWFAETANDIWEGILRWYEDTGQPLISSDKRASQGESSM